MHNYQLKKSLIFFFNQKAGDKIVNLVGFLFDTICFHLTFGDLETLLNTYIVISRPLILQITILKTSSILQQN